MTEQLAIDLTCRCGARLTAAGRWPSDVHREREAFDVAHQVCRDREQSEQTNARVMLLPKIADPAAPTMAELEAGLDVEVTWRDPEPCRLLCCPRSGFHTRGEC